MNRLLGYLTGANNQAVYPHDVDKLKEAIPELAFVPNRLIEEMYADYSDDFAASWLIVDEHSIEGFRRWLL